MSSAAAVVLAAGIGTRMKSRQPKVLHPIAGRPMVWYVLAALTEAGVLAGRTVVVIARGPHGEQVRRECASYWPDLRFAVQESPLGTGHAALAAGPALPADASPVIVAYGDTPLLRTTTLRDLLRMHLSGGHVATIVTGHLPDPTGYGRIVRDQQGRVLRIVEERDATPEQRRLTEVNSGLSSYQSDWLWTRLPTLAPSSGGEVYLTDLVTLAVAEEGSLEMLELDDITETVGVNTRVQLAAAAAEIRRRLAEAHMLAGVTLLDPSTTYLDVGVELASDTVVMPNTHLLGHTRVGSGCVIGPNCVVRDSEIGDRSQVVTSVLDGAMLEQNVRVGPFAHLRPGTHLEAGVEVGTGSEIKNSRLGRGSKMHHFGYVGDASVGADVNVGAGAITCNYDGARKYRTVIGDGAFIGSDTLLVAPVQVGCGALTGAGAVVTRDVAAGQRVAGVPARPIGRAAPEAQPSTGGAAAQAPRPPA